MNRTTPPGPACRRACASASPRIRPWRSSWRPGSAPWEHRWRRCRSWRRSARPGSCRRATPPRSIPWPRARSRSPWVGIPTVSPTNTRTMAALVVVAALVAGAVLGVVGDRAYLWHEHRLTPGARAERFVAGRIVEHLDRELHFTPQQKAAVQQIIDQHRARIDAISAAVRPQMRQEIDATNAEIE